MEEEEPWEGKDLTKCYETCSEPELDTKDGEGENESQDERYVIDYDPDLVFIVYQ